MELFLLQSSKKFPKGKKEGKQTNKQTQTSLCSSIIEPIHPATSPEGVCFQQLPSFKLFKRRKQVKGVTKSRSQCSPELFWLFHLDLAQEKAAQLCPWPWPEGTSARVCLPGAKWRSPGSTFPGSRLLPPPQVQEISSLKHTETGSCWGSVFKWSEAWENILHRNKKRFWKTIVCNYIHWSF